MFTAFMLWKNDQGTPAEISKESFIKKMRDIFYVIKVNKGNKSKRAKFVISKRIDGQFMFNVVAPNGEIIATSEGYRSRQGCNKGIDAIQRYAEEAFIDDQSDVK